MSEPELERHHRTAIYAMGLFIINWGWVEGSMEVAIAKELGLDALNGSILTAGMQFKPKSNLLRALLKRNPANQSKIDLINKIQNISTRNDIAHGIPGIDANGLTFFRRTNNGVFESKLKTFSDEAMLKTAMELGDLATQLQDLFGISDDTYEAFFQDSHRAANKS